MADDQIKPWKRVDSKKVFESNHLSVFEDTVELPTGKPAKYVRFSPNQRASVAIIAINSDGKLLVQREYSYPPNKVLWQLPGGGVHHGEDILDAAKRELAEEAGLNARKTSEIGYYYTMNRRSDQQQYVVVCEDLFEHKLPEDDDEFIENYWFSPAEIEKMIKTGEIVTAPFLAAFCLWQNQRNSQ